MLKIITECEICNSTIKNAVRCIQCQNFFCKACIEDWINSNKAKNLEQSCPHCRTNNFNYIDYPELDNLIKSSSILKCKKCLRIFFTKEEFQSHQTLCLQIKCIICHEIFKDSDSFINHFEQEGRYKEKFLICNYLNANPYNYIQNNIINEINENTENETPSEDVVLKKLKEYKHPSDLIENEIQINPFKNNFKTIITSSVNNNIINKYDHYLGALNKEYDIFYCYKDNRVNNKICSPGNELCPTCMKINQEYHRLKKHYLINAAGRVCTYKRKKMHCLCHFQRFIKKENKLFCPDLICFNNDICKPCMDIIKIIDLYFNKNLMNKLKKRDEDNGY